MAESYRKGIANHPGRESCVVGRKADHEASTGVQAGWVWSRGIDFFQGADVVRQGGRQQQRPSLLRDPTPPTWSETPDMPGNSTRENRETPAASAVGEAAGRRENAMSDESFVLAAAESHDCVVPAKAPNKDRTGSAEGLEGRRSTKESTRELNPSRTQSRGIGSRGLEGAREAAKRDKGLRFTALLHHVTKGLLRDSFYSLQKQAAPEWTE